MKIELVDRPFEILSLNREAGSFVGLASVFGSLVEAWIPTVFAPGAFAKTIRENSRRFRILYQHDVNEPLARPGLKRNASDILEESERGLVVGAKISETARGRDVITLLKDGVLDEMSVGWDPVKDEKLPISQVIAAGLLLSPEQYASWRPTELVRVVREARLWEASIVTWGADPMTVIEAAARNYSRRVDPSTVRAQNAKRLAQLTEAKRASAAWGRQ